MKSDGQTADELIRIEAYLLSEKAGHPQGMDDYFWSEATVIVAGRAGEKAAKPKRLAAKGKSKADADSPAAEESPKAKKKAGKKAAKKKG